MGRGSAEHDQQGLPARQPPVLQVLDPGPIPGADLFLDEQASEVFHDWTGRWPEETQFQLVRVALTALEGGAPHSPEMYLADGDEDGYEITMELEERYRHGLPVDPIVLCLTEGMGGWSIPDGCHRSVAAHAAGLDSIEAYLPLPK